MIRFFAVVAVSIFAASSVHADVCTDSLRRMHHAQDAEREWFAGAVEMQLGKGVTDFDFNFFVQCRQMMPVAQKRLKLIETIVVHNNAVNIACNDDGAPDIGGYTPFEMQRILKEYIAVCGDGHGEN